ncbi:MAG: hypothetical protein HYZ36_03825 [Pedosphaera parvula]|nr:hypothetical protein [Pedosphaera parvula]
MRAPDGRLFLATSTIHDVYQSTYLSDARIDGGGGRVLFSDDQGETWGVLHDFGHPVIDIALDPNNANALYASVVHSTEGGIFRSNNINQDAASTWTRLSAPPRTQGHPFNIHVLDDGTLVCTYSGRRDAGGVFTDSSGVFVSTNGGNNWLDRSHVNMHYWVKDLVLDPNDPAQNTWYVGVWSGWGGPIETNNEAGGLYKTSDRGQNWERLNNMYRVSSCGINPGVASEMYVTTEMDGLWHCENLTAPAPTFSLVEDYPFRQPERVFYNPFKDEVWVTSFGNGIRIQAAE